MKAPPILLPLPFNAAFAAAIASTGVAQVGEVTFARFPDSETYARVESDIAGRDVLLVATQHEPDAQFMTLAFLADAARELDAASVGLIAPYLAYMRQDARFKPGEAVAARSYGRLLSRLFNSVITVDPHLHRLGSLSAVLDIPATAVDVSPLLAQWIRAHVARPLIVGPDSESRQWVKGVAETADAPFVVLDKIRRGNENVDISIAADLAAFHGRTPVLVDDIISTGHTLAQAARHLSGRGFVPPICVGVHAVFAHGAEQTLRSADISTVVTTNTIPHLTNAIDVVPAIADRIAGPPRT